MFIISYSLVIIIMTKIPDKTVMNKNNKEEIFELNPDLHSSINISTRLFPASSAGITSENAG